VFGGHDKAMTVVSFGAMVSNCVGSRDPADSGVAVSTVRSATTLLHGATFDLPASALAEAGVSRFVMGSSD
jgi:hypothetical protein